MDIKLLASQFYEYSTYIKGYSKCTITRYRQVINYYSNFSNVTIIEEVSVENVRALFFTGRSVRKWMPNTYIVYHKTLGVFFRWCVVHGYLKSNPIDEIEVPKLEKRLPPKLTKQEALLLLEIVFNYPYENSFLRYRNHAIFSLFLFAGLRSKELLHLRFTDVDIENLTIFVNQGKGSKDRFVPIHFTLAQSLSRYITERKKLNKTCSAFFVSSIKNTGYTQNGLKRLVVQVRKASKISFTIHKLRHTFATLMLEGGCDIYSLSKMMGHSDIKTTTIYLAASADHLRSQISKHPLNSMVVT